MATKSKYGKYVTTELKRGVITPGGKGPRQIAQGYRDGYRLGMEHVIWMDSEVLPGAYYGDYAWRWPATMQDQMPMPRTAMPELVTPEMVKSGKVPGIMPHSHPFIEILSYVGTNINDPSDLGGEIEFWLEDEKFVLTRSFMVYIPANMEHCPLVLRRIDAPMFHFTLGPSDRYIEHENFPPKDFQKGVTEKHQGKNAKYVVDTPKANAKYPPYRVKNDPKIVKPVVQIDADTVPGAEFYAEGKWIMPGSKTEVKLCESHTHAFNEVLGFFGDNYDNIQDLGAEIELTIGDEKNIADRSFAACVPAGFPHGPLIIRNIQRPIFHVSSGQTRQYK